MSGLKLSDSLTLPIDAVTQTFACIGRRGAGKTYLAGLLAEQMLDAGAQIIILEPVGNWWGLRLQADGKTKGKDIFVIGGSHGDVPIYAESGARIARLLVEKPISAIIDTSEFREGERKRFAADFAAEFFHLKKQQTSAVHLFIEEAQLFAPQFPRPSRGENFSEAEMLGAFERIIRLGRNYGIGATLITQRPQSVNKEVLNQTECLCVLQVNGRQERDALQRWVEEHSAADRALVAELPGLHQGEGFVWSPSWLRIFKKMNFAKKTTFDSSATPKVGAKTKAAKLSKVDVASLKADLEDVIARAERDDPKALHKRIAELERELKKKAPAPAIAPRITRELLLKDYTAEISDILHSQVKPQVLKAFGAPMTDVLAGLQSAVEVVRKNLIALEDPKAWTLTVRYAKPAVQKSTRAAVQQSTSPPLQTDNGKFGGPEQRILDALAWFEAIGIDEPEQVAVAFMAGYSVKSSSFGVPKSRLIKQGAISYPSPGRMQLTETGRGLAHDVGVPATNEGLQKMILSKLDGPARRLLEPLLRIYPHHMSNDELATEAGYSVSSSSYGVPRSRLKSLGLIEYPASGQLRARDILFPLKG